LKKIYVLDANLPVYDPGCISNFEDNDLIIPSIVLRELNHLKTKNTEAGRNARRFMQLLDALSEKYPITRGIPITNENGQEALLWTEGHDEETLEEIRRVFGDINNDDMILSVALRLHKQYKEQKRRIKQQINRLTAARQEIKNENERAAIEEEIATLKEEKNNLKPVILVSKDTNLRIRSRSFDIPSQDYENDKINHNTEYYDGWRILRVPDEVVDAYYEQRRLYEHMIHEANLGERDRGEFSFDMTGLPVDIDAYGLQPNEYVFLVKESKGELDEEKLWRIYKNEKTLILKYDAKKKTLVPLKDYTHLLAPYNIYPRNAHQRIVVDMMFDRDVPFKTIKGTAGTGKTLFVLLCAIIMTNDLNWFDEIILTRPLVPTEEDIGTLPGDEREKISPYMRPFYNNLQFITYKQHKGRDMDLPEFELEMYHIRAVAPTYFRGTTMPRTILIMDEGQNGTKHLWKTAVTRMGEDSIFVGIGDIEQIDHPYLDRTNCGLTHAIELMKDDSIAEHCTLVIGERSELSKIIAAKWS
jgi:PhoH-like ATPase